jgi:hypothetical protein
MGGGFEGFADTSRNKVVSQDEITLFVNSIYFQQSVIVIEELEFFLVDCDASIAFHMV